MMCGGETALPTTVLAVVAAVATGGVVSWHRKWLQLLRSLHNIATCRRSSTAGYCLTSELSDLLLECGRMRMLQRLLRHQRESTHGLGGPG